MNITYRSVSVYYPDPKQLPQRGDVYEVMIGFTTFGGETYRRGDLLYVVDKTRRAPHGRRCSLGNLLAGRSIDKITVWTNIALMVAEGTLKLERSVKE